MSRMCSSKSSGRSCLVVRRAMAPSSPAARHDPAGARRAAGPQRPPCRASPCTAVLGPLQPPDAARTSRTDRRRQPTRTGGTSCRESSGHPAGCAAAPLGGRRRPARRQDRARPADPARGRRAAGGVLRAGLRPVEVLPVLLADAAPVRPRRGPVHPGRPRPAGGVRDDPAGPDDRGRAVRRGRARRGRGRLPRRGPAPGPRDRPDPPRAPRPGRPRARHRAVRRRGAARTTSG